MAETPHLLHVTPTFVAGGAQVRLCQLVNHFGPAYRHTVMALDGRFEAAGRIEPGIAVHYASLPFSSNPLRMLRGAARAIRSIAPRLVLTYNWGAIDAALAALLSRIAPVVHGEDGFGDDEAAGQKRRRVLYRRFVLPYAHAVVAPSQNLMRIMRNVWKLPERNLNYIPNGIDTSRFSPAADHTPKPEIVIGTVGGLRQEKRFAALIEACATLSRKRPVRLVIAGDGPEKSNLEQKARDLGFSSGLELPGYLPDPREVYRKCDIFALSSSTEQMPLSVLEAMACGLPIVSTDVGDVRHMVSAENRPFVVAAGRGYEAALERLTGDAALRNELGAANRLRCVEKYSFHAMAREYGRLYEGALRLARIPR